MWPSAVAVVSLFIVVLPGRGPGLISIIGFTIITYLHPHRSVAYHCFIIIHVRKSLFILLTYW